MTIETKLINDKYPLPGKYPLRVVNVMQENDKTIMLVEPDEVTPGIIQDRWLKLNENYFVVINDCLIEDENFLKGKSFVFTGTIDKRVELTNALTINYHGKICGPLTEKVDYLIVGNEPTKRRINRALSWGIPMISAEFLYEWLNKKREEAIKKQVFGNFNTTAFSEAMTKVANQLKRDLDKMAIRSATMREATELANVQGMAFIKVTPESCEVVKARDVVMIWRDSEPDASQAVNPVGLHQSTGQRPVAVELNRFSNDAHTTPSVYPCYKTLIAEFLASPGMRAEIDRHLFNFVSVGNIAEEFAKQIGNVEQTGFHKSHLGNKSAGVNGDKSENLSYLFELRSDGSIFVKDNGKEYHFPVWLSEMAIAYCGKSKQATNHLFYQRYDLVKLKIDISSKTYIEYSLFLTNFSRLIDYVYRSL